MTFRNHQGLLSTTMPASSWTFNNIQQPSEPFSNLQVLSVTTKHLPGTITHLPHPSIIFSNLQGLSSPSGVYQPPSPYSDTEDSEGH